MGSRDMGIGTGIVEVFARLFRSPSSSEEPIQLNPFRLCEFIQYIIITLKLVFVNIFAVSDC